MKTEYLCQEYWNWLVANPENARDHRSRSMKNAFHYGREGDTEKALVAHGEAFEIAHAVLLSMRSPDGSQTMGKEDLVSFGSLAIQLARTYGFISRLDKATNLLKTAVYRLKYLAPLYATQPELVEIIFDIINAMEQGIAFYERQTVSAHQLH